MKVSDICSNKDFKLLTKDFEDREISKPFCCDLLSIAMGKAPAGSCWVTVMANANTLAVATLTDVSCIVIAEGISFDDALIDKANEEDIIVFSTSLPVYDAASIVGAGL